MSEIDLPRKQSAPFAECGSAHHKVRREMALKFSFRVLASALLLIAAACGKVERTNDDTLAGAAWPAPEPSSLADGPHKQEVLYGENLIRRTFAFVGPNAADAAMRYAGNNLACGSCHLDGGRRRYGLSFIGVAGAYPRDMARENAMQSLEQRINGCFERSMNGRALPEDSREMTAIIAYIQFLSEAAPDDLEGRGAPAAELLERAADPARGALVYTTSCAVCHGANGQGLRNVDDVGYTYPAALGTRQLQHWRGDAPDHHFGQFHPRQHALRRHARRSTTYGGAGV